MASRTVIIGAVVMAASHGVGMVELRCGADAGNGFALTYSVARTLTGATSARITTRSDGAFWIGHGSASERALLRVTGAGAMTEHREPVPARMFDLTARDAFWLDGTTVHVSTPCLR